MISSRKRLRPNLNQLRKKRSKSQLQLRHLFSILTPFQLWLSLLLSLLQLRKLLSPQSKSRANQPLLLRLLKPKKPIRPEIKREEVKSVTEEMDPENQEEVTKERTENVKKVKITVKNVNIAPSTRREKSKHLKKKAIVLTLSLKLEPSVKRKSDSLRTKDSSLSVSPSPRLVIKKSKKSSMIANMERSIIITTVPRTPD